MEEYTQLFSSPIGESTFSTRQSVPDVVENVKFSSPIGESTFSTIQEKEENGNERIVFVPYRGIYFLYASMYELMITFQMFSSPIGEST